MDSNPKFKYTVYKTTNIINNKIYIGIHKTKDTNDYYLGSGIILKRAIQKYGIENFKKEILFIFDSPNEMYDKEKEIVNKLYLESENTYNIIIGGHGTWDYINSNGKNLYGKNGDIDHGGKNLLNGHAAIKYIKENGLWESWRKNISEKAKEKYAKDGFHWKGRTHREESKKKISEKLKNLMIGNKNPNFGKRWIYSDDLQLNKSIRNEELESYLSSKWKMGRKNKYIKTI